MLRQDTRAGVLPADRLLGFPVHPATVLTPDALALSQGTLTRQQRGLTGQVQKALLALVGTENASDTMYQLAMRSSDPEDVKLATRLFKQSGQSIHPGKLDRLNKAVAIRELALGGGDNEMALIKTLVQEAEPVIHGRAVGGDLIHVATDVWSNINTPVSSEMLTWTAMRYAADTGAPKKAINALAKRSGDSVPESLTTIAVRQHLVNGIHVSDALAQDVIQAIQVNTENPNERIGRLLSVGMRAASAKTVKSALAALKNDLNNEAVDAIVKLVKQTHGSDSFNLSFSKNIQQQITIQGIELLKSIQMVNGYATIGMQDIIENYRRVNPLNRLDRKVNQAYDSALRYV